MKEEGKTSMLHKILTDMYVEPELLDELDEEQKQILFCKMREEQLRRWAVAEAEFAEEVAKNGAKPKSTRRIQWLNDPRGDPWTWVMGEHENDPTIDQLLDRDFQEMAAEQAEVEAERLRAEEEEELKAKLREDAIDLPDYTPPSVSTPRAPTPGPSTSNPPKSEDEEEAGTKEASDEYAALMQKLREAKLTVRQQAEMRDPAAIQLELHKEREALERRLRDEAERRIEEEKERRKSEIYESLKIAAQAKQEEAEKEQEAERQWWRIQESKSKAADEEIRMMARRARETLKSHTDVVPLSLQAPAGPSSPGPASPNGSSSSASGKKRIPKPASRDAIRDWFVREELPRGTGKDPKTGLIALWFHGLISREEAESLLRGRQFGSFLVRVSERIWGFTLSFALSTTTVKHFLIERVEKGYQFMGTQQIAHKHLWDLVSYHESVPITGKGREILGAPVGQLSKANPDYAALFPPSQGPVYAKIRGHLPRNGSPLRP